MEENPRLFEIFIDVQQGLPRQGPGCEASTLEAFSLCSELPKQSSVLDVGCGPGMQTVALAKIVDGRITAVDVNQGYLEELKARAEAANVADRIEIRTADMNNLPFADQSFDLIWAEGSAYIMGFRTALASWNRLLKPGGYIAVSELVWLQPDPPKEAAEFFHGEYPAMTDVETVLATIRICGYLPLGHFTLPDTAWWEHYYTPLEGKLQGLAKKYKGDDEAFRILEATKSEIEIRRRFADCYGYEFFIGRKPADRLSAVGPGQ
ncbi:MAG: class I SAM-dependent methyltransferase [Phycisphaerales bacterium]|nr:class I SAM-dependent methyltransferase [Phycisphaerales bacterium]